jgi:hypothetical protein
MAKKCNLCGADKLETLSPLPVKSRLRPADWNARFVHKRTPLVMSVRPGACLMCTLARRPPAKGFATSARVGRIVFATTRAKRQNMAREPSLEEMIQDVRRSLADPPSCAWGGCTAQYSGKDPPVGWVRITLLRSLGDKPPVYARVGVLCPKHARAIEGLLKGTPGQFGTT